MADRDEIHEGASVDRVTCSEVTGIDCDYVAELDASVDRADRGSVTDQLLAQLTTHISKAHPDRPVSPDELSKLRDRFSS